jgi:hypothetical protein
MNRGRPAIVRPRPQMNIGRRLFQPTTGRLPPSHWRARRPPITRGKEFSMAAQAPVLIIGAAGKTGRRVNTLLRARGVATRCVSRSTTIAFDWTRPEGWT